MIKDKAEKDKQEYKSKQEEVEKEISKLNDLEKEKKDHKEAMEIISQSLDFKSPEIVKTQVQPICIREKFIPQNMTFQSLNCLDLSHAKMIRSLKEKRDFTTD